MVEPYRERERKFLVIDRDVLNGLRGTSMAQGYLLSTKQLSLRVRLTDNESAYLTLKGPRHGAERLEYEFEIPWSEGEGLLALCEPNVITKIRYPVLDGGQLWEVDVFQDQNDGLVLAEIELNVDQTFERVPPWCGREVTDDDRYYNEYLASNPYESWRWG